MNAVQRLRQRNEFRTHRRKIATDIISHPLLSLLPTLLEIPIELIGPDGDPWNLNEIMAQHHRVVLTGIVGSGRSLVLHQLARQWATSGSSYPLPLCITLPTFDDGCTAPDILLTEWIRLFREESHAKSSGTLLSRMTSARLPTEPLHDCGLLIDGWEELPISRQEVWRTLLVQASQHWPQTDIMVVLPLTEATWPGFTSLAIPAPTPEIINLWLQYMLPDHYDTVVQSLQPGGSLATLNERLTEIALLAWVVPQTDFPKHRADLYAQTLRSLLATRATQESPTNILAELQLLAAYDEIPAVAMAELVTPTPTGTLRFTNPLFRMYLAATQLVQETRFDLIRKLAPTEGLEVARFSVTMIDDPSQVYKHLWNKGKPHVDDIITLGHCLYERQTATPLWNLRILSALAQVARNHEQAQQYEAYALLCQLTPALDTLLQQLLHAPNHTAYVIPRLLAILPTNLAHPRATQLAFEQNIPDEFGWALTDVLIQITNPSVEASIAPEETQALARWTYVHVIQETHNRSYVMQTIQDGIATTFKDSAAGDGRLLRLAATLIDDTDAPTRARVDALLLLSHNNQPSALTVIERACHDHTAEVRQKALAMLVERDPSLHMPLSAEPCSIKNSCGKYAWGPFNTWVHWQIRVLRHLWLVVLPIQVYLSTPNS